MNQISSDKVFIIAELSANHGNDLDTAIKSIKSIKKTGADAVKLQTYRPDTITLNSSKKDFIIKGGTIWDEKRLFDLYNEAHLPWEWHEKLFRTARDEGLICFSSPFDKSAVDYLENLNCPIYKIASFEITDIPLIKYTAEKLKPMIISTGISNYDDIDLAIKTCRSVGNNDITLLKCTSSYPAPTNEINLVMMQKFAEDFNVKVGISDHTLGITVPVVATTLGAKVIEKHFIMDKSIEGPDSSFSLDETEFKKMVESVRIAEECMGELSYELTEKQKINRQFSRSLYVSCDIKKGEVFSESNIKSVRPGYGIHPKHYNEIIGKKSKRDLEMGDRLSFNDIYDD